MADVNNPYDVCTWRSVSECADCRIAGRLKCRFKLGDLLRFIGMFSLFAVPAVVGVIAGGYGWSLVGWAVFWLVFFELWEIRILCTHCPYYAERGTTLHCIANYGSLKVWKYRPGTMNLFEKTQLMVGFAILGGFPFPFLLLGDQYLWAFTALCGLTAFFWTLHKWTCSKCVNFSCPLNSVSKTVVDAYLEHNPVMLKAWEESGYRLDPP